MKAFIKGFNLEVELKRLPYVNQHKLNYRSNDFILETTDGRVFVVPRERDFLLKFESYEERIQAEDARAKYYHKCQRYLASFKRLKDEIGITESEFVSCWPFVMED